MGKSTGHMTEAEREERQRRLWFSADETEFYVANVEGGSVSDIDTLNLTEPVGAAPVQIGLMPSSKEIDGSRRDEDRMAVIDISSCQMTNRVGVGRNPIHMFATPDLAYVNVANQGTAAEPNDTGAEIDAVTGQIVKTIATGGGHGVPASADGAYARRG